MEPSGGVAQHHIHVPGLSSLKCVEQYGAGVRALVLPDDLAFGPLCPDLQLVGGGGAEGIGGAQHHPFALLFQAGGDLSDGGGLAHTVDADEDADAGLRVQLQGGVPHLHLRHQDLPQGLPDLLLALQVLLADLGPQLFHGVRGSVHAKICHDEGFLQFFKKVLVRLRKPGEQIAGDFFQLVKKAHCKLLFSCDFPHFLNLHFLLLRRDVANRRRYAARCRFAALEGMVIPCKIESPFSFPLAEKKTAIHGQKKRR